MIPFPRSSLYFGDLNLPFSYFLAQFFLSESVASSSDMSCTFPSFLDTKHLLDRRLIYDVGGASGLRRR
jgi:hypothetical protein